MIPPQVQEFVVVHWVASIFLLLVLFNVVSAYFSRDSFLPTTTTNKKRRKFTLETKDGLGEWEYKTGATSTTKIGNGKGRSSWIPSTVDKVETYPFNRNENANSADLIYRKMMMEKNAQQPITPRDDKETAAAVRGSVFYSRLQTDDGFWPGDYGGPMFLLPGLVIACYVTNIDLGNARKSAMLRYVMAHQHDNGGWGTHIEGHTTVFGSTLNYTAARLLGLAYEDPRAVKGRNQIKKMGGAVAAPQWAKFWLATLGAYEWNGVNPTPPELWLLPYWFPFHPGRMWCHCRMVYLPMSVLFGSRYVYEEANSDKLVLSLRDELFATKYSEINWGSFAVRECIAQSDLYNPQSWLMTVANHVLHHTIENPIVRAVLHFPLHGLRERALDFAFSYVHAEDKHTNWVAIGPVSKAFHLIATYAKFGPNSPNFQNHINRIDDYLWLAEDGMKMQGYNGSMLWDTCFATHAIATAIQATEANPTNISNDDVDVMKSSLKKASKFVDEMQVREDVEDRGLYFRDKSTGGWPFSSRDHGWPISDCTAEGIKATILLSSMEDVSVVSQERIEQAVSIVLDLQNTATDNGWASYELNRGYSWYELLNPAQVFGDIMIDYSYVECTSACVQALCEFALHYPDSHYVPQARVAAQKGAKFIVSKQRPDGSWYGSWAVCFTYAAWFGIEGLASALYLCEDKELRKSYEEALVKGCEFLLEKQNSDDSGWGEDVEACSVQEWVGTPSQVVQTSWAVLGLVKAAEYFRGKNNRELEKRFSQRAQKACQLLRQRQLADGDWAQENISGVFNKSCAISYTAYRNVFPIWALSRFALYDSK